MNTPSTALLRRTFAAVLALGGLVPGAPAAAADPSLLGPVDKATCLDSVGKGQRLRDAHKLVDARDKFRVCARAECPAVLQTDCANWLAEVDKTLPSVVLAAKDGIGRDIVDVKVSVDDRLLTTTLDGQALPVDPGLRTFVFENVEGRKVTKQLLIKEGEKARTIAVVFRNPNLAASQSPGSGSSSQPEVASSGGTSVLKVFGLVVAGLGLGGLGTGIGIAVDAKTKDSAAQTELGMARATDSTSAVNEGNIATVVFSVGGGLAAAGLIVFLAAPSAGGERTASWLPRNVALGTDGRRLVLGGSFE